MHHQTQPPQIFTVFGSYPIGPQGDYFPSNSSRPDSEDRRGTTKVGSAAVVSGTRAPSVSRSVVKLGLQAAPSRAWTQLIALVAVPRRPGLFFDWLAADAPLRRDWGSRTPTIEYLAAQHSPINEIAVIR